MVSVQERIERSLHKNANTHTHRVREREGKGPETGRRLHLAEQGLRRRGGGSQK